MNLDDQSRNLLEKSALISSTMASSSDVPATLICNVSNLFALASLALAVFCSLFACCKAALIFAFFPIPTSPFSFFRMISVPVIYKIGLFVSQIFVLVACTCWRSCSWLSTAYFNWNLVCKQTHSFFNSSSVNSTYETDSQSPDLFFHSTDIRLSGSEDCKLHFSWMTSPSLRNSEEENTLFIRLKIIWLWLILQLRFILFCWHPRHSQLISRWLNPNPWNQLANDLRQIHSN